MTRSGITMAALRKIDFAFQISIHTSKMSNFSEVFEIVKTNYIEFRIAEIKNSDRILDSDDARDKAIDLSYAKLSNDDKMALISNYKFYTIMKFKIVSEDDGDFVKYLCDCIKKDNTEILHALFAAKTVSEICKQFEDIGYNPDCICAVMENHPDFDTHLTDSQILDYYILKYKWQEFENYLPKVMCAKTLCDLYYPSNFSTELRDKIYIRRLELEKKSQS